MRAHDGEHEISKNSLLATEYTCFTSLPATEYSSCTDFGWRLWLKGERKCLWNLYGRKLCREWRQQIGIKSAAQI
jgi:hypothetical protein